MGSALSAAAPAMVLEVLEIKLRRVRAWETEIILFMLFGFVQTPDSRAAIQPWKTGVLKAWRFRPRLSSRESVSARGKISATDETRIEQRIFIPIPCFIRG